MSMVTGSSKNVAVSSLKGSKEENGKCGNRSLRRTIFKPSQIKNNARNEKLRSQLRDKFSSPTDRLLSPCSQKLNQYKVKKFAYLKNKNISAGNSAASGKKEPTKLSFTETNTSDSE
ncbi:hypothetical protein KAFR_0E02120 [Kazachstania africana CBS 2517]|uniref:Uncharacterized protein n=1 Tax=Kazachstania africana (strain ATCC 22294 / BCRC 22015 / CBS 2517 / CECT 1963 / NBRC 1671 / NRRL Y-8276) TaxID=1071382 RepID=H2AVG5_KAZAF|nr:hypothetical protein KAFR_0E02120 [Kazachstania africana CBS 2517]CCF58365.1 hypothetical protein KAFR_0E02120 [Kazachstania africana CBS 2517]